VAQSEKAAGKEKRFSVCDCGIREGRHFEDDEFVHEKQQGLLANI